MTLKQFKSLATPFLLSLAMVSAASISGRLYKDTKDETVQAAAVSSSSIACVDETSGGVIQ